MHRNDQRETVLPCFISKGCSVSEKGLCPRNSGDMMMMSERQCVSVYNDSGSYTVSPQKKLFARETEPHNTRCNKGGWGSTVPVVNDRDQTHGATHQWRGCATCVAAAGRGTYFAISIQQRGKSFGEGMGSSDKTRGQEDLRRRGIRTITLTYETNRWVCQSARAHQQFHPP